MLDTLNSISMRYTPLILHLVKFISANSYIQQNSDSELMHEGIGGDTAGEKI